MNNLLKHAIALLAIVMNKTDEWRYRAGTTILRIPVRNVTLVKTKMFLAGLIADD